MRAVAHLLLELAGWLWIAAAGITAIALIVGAVWFMRWELVRDNRALRKENARLRGRLYHPLHEPLEHHESIDAFLHATIGTGVHS
jgi:hypothetical protein